MACENTVSQVPSRTNIELVAGNDITISIDVNKDLTDHTITATIVTGGETDIDFTVTPVDIAAGQFTISLTAEQTADLTNGMPWSLSWVDDAGNTLTVIVGSILIWS